MNSQDRVVYLSLGSNVGDRLKNLQMALDALSELAEVTKVSSIYETSPVGPVRQGPFYNIAVEIRTSLPPEVLMIHLLHIEENLGRQRDIKWGPRTLDIDIIFYDRWVVDERGLAIPHARYAQRRFVLEPMCEIAPDWICPVLHKSMRELFELLQDHGAVVRTEYGLKITEVVH